MTLPDIAGTYFDGASARPHAVILRLGDRLEIRGAQIDTTWDPADIVAGETAPPLTRLSRAGEAARVEFTDEAFAAAVAARCPDLHRAERMDYGGRWRIALWSVAAGISVLLIAIYAVPALASRLAPLVPDAVESQLGTAVEGQIVSLLDAPPLCEHPPARAVLDRLIASMTAGRALPAGQRVSVRRHDTANALTLPGARIIVLSALIDQARNPNEFAGVLAHEFGHVAVRDPTRSLIQASGTSFLLSLILGDLTGSTVIVAVGQAALSAGYSRDAERAADAFSVAMMRDAGGDPTALATILERIAGDDGKEGGVTSMLRSHPFTAERAKRIRAMAGSGTGDRHILSDADWKTLQGICTEVASSRKS